MSSIVRSVLGQGLTLAQVAATFGVSRQWVHVPVAHGVLLECPVVAVVRVAPGT